MFQRLTAMLALPLFLAASGVLAGCEAADDVEATEEDELIAFPAAAYASAPLVAYGSTTTRPFVESERFVAVKFNGAKGDVVTFRVTSDRATVAYLVKDQRNLNAIRGEDRFRFTLTSGGEHFIMMRTRDRKAANVTVELSASVASGSPVSNAALVAAAPAGNAPVYQVSFPMQLGRRSCVTATGCSAPTPAPALLNPDLPMVLSALPSGDVAGKLIFGGSAASFAVASSAPIEGSGTLLLAPVASGTAPSPLAVRFTLSFESGGMRLELRSEISRSGNEWVEYYGAGSVRLDLQPKGRDLASTLPPAGEISVDTEALDDEEVISRFAPGSSFKTMVATRLEPVAGSEGARRCGPRTGCSPWTAGTTLATGATPLFDIATSNSVTLEITGPDSYQVRIKRSEQTVAVIPIVGGKGTFVPVRAHPAFGKPAYEVRVTEAGLLFLAPFAKTSIDQVASLPTPSGGSVDEGGYRSELYWYPTTLFRFDQAW